MILYIVFRCMTMYDLPIWEGDKVFFKLLEEREDFFTLKLVYSEDDRLLEYVIG